jgi:DNA-binding SARP family transcriptional activator
LEKVAIRVQLCGRVAIDLGGRRVEQGLPGRQGRLLFVYLAAHRLRAVTRDELAEALWPGGPPTAWDTALNALLSKLRRLLGTDLVPARGDPRLVLPATAWVDLEAARDAVHRAESAVALGDWPRAWGAAQVTMFAARRGFLPGEDVAWADEIRRRLAELYLRALEAYATAALGLGGPELATAERAGRELVATAPFHERGYRLLMRTLVACGNDAEALRLYDDLRRLLRDELGIAPSAATQELHTALVRGSTLPGGPL